MICFLQMEWIRLKREVIKKQLKNVSPTFLRKLAREGLKEYREFKILADQHLCHKELREDDFAQSLKADHLLKGMLIVISRSVIFQTDTAVFDDAEPMINLTHQKKASVRSNHASEKLIKIDLLKYGRIALFQLHNPRACLEHPVSLTCPFRSIYYRELKTSCANLAA